VAKKTQPRVRPAAQRRSPPELLRVYGDLRRKADDQRRVIARRLHDSAQQTLAAASMSLALLDRQAGALGPAARAALSEAMDIVGKCNQELRELAHLVYPPLLDGMGLGPALRGLAARFGTTRVAMTLDTMPRLPASRELTVFKLIEEALEAVFAPADVVQIHVGPTGTLTMLGSPRRGAEVKAADIKSALQWLQLRAESDGGRWQVRRPRVSGRGRLRIDVRFARTSSPK
jgi:signal transduction histidine kinase